MEKKKRLIFGIKNEILINNRYDRVIAVILIVFAIVCYRWTSYRKLTETIYLTSLIWYIFIIFFVVRTRIFTGLGLYILYLLFFVQMGALAQKLYYEFLDETMQILAIYNFSAPIVLILFYRFARIKTIEFRNARISDEWVTILFLFATTVSLIFFAQVGTIPLFAADAENFRVQAMSGRGYLIIMSSACFQLSVLLTRDAKRRCIRTLIAVLLLLGTGYRSQALEIILLLYLTYWIGRGKKFILSAGVLVTGLGGLYALVGVIRSGISWRVQSLYLPVIWRLYVNSNNFNEIVRFFPTSKLLHGESFLMDLAILLPGAQKSFMFQLKDMMGMTFAGGSLTPGVFGEAYANFGAIGAVVWPNLMLIIVTSLDNFIRKRVDGRSYFVLAFCLCGPSTSSFFSSMTMGFIPTLLVYFVLQWFSRKYKIRIGLNDTK